MKTISQSFAHIQDIRQTIESPQRNVLDPDDIAPIVAEEFGYDAYELMGFIREDLLPLLERAYQDDAPSLGALIHGIFAMGFMTGITYEKEKGHAGG